LRHLYHTLAAALALWLYQLTAAMAAPSTAGMFTPKEESYAAGSLKRIFGCAIDNFWTFQSVAPASGSCGAADTIIGQAINYFNVGCLVFAAVVMTYTLYSLVADTANDGAVLGNSSDTKYTLFRSGIGAALALPVANGYSVVQLEQHCCREFGCR
jgi:conjugal transfer/type IV secretion protein DotA/TraY